VRNTRASAHCTTQHVELDALLAISSCLAAAAFSLKATPCCSIALITEGRFCGLLGGLDSTFSSSFDSSHAKSAFAACHTRTHNNHSKCKCRCRIDQGAATSSSRGPNRFSDYVRDVGCLFRFAAHDCHHLDLGAPPLHGRKRCGARGCGSHGHPIHRSLVHLLMRMMRNEQ
jgi:hypothetical protein